MFKIWKKIYIFFKRYSVMEANICDFWQDLDAASELSDDVWLAESKIQSIVYHGTTALVESKFHPLTHFSTRHAANACINRSRIRLSRAYFTLEQWETIYPYSDELPVQGHSSGHIYPCYIRIRNPLRIWDHGNEHTPIFILSQLKICLKEQKNSSLSCGVTNAVNQIQSLICDLRLECPVNEKLIAKLQSRICMLVVNEIISHGYDGLYYELSHEDAGETAWVILNGRQVRPGFGSVNPSNI